MLNIIIAKKESSQDIFAKFVNFDEYTVKTIFDFTAQPFKNTADIDFILSDVDSLSSNKNLLFNQIVEMDLTSRLIVVGNEKKFIKLFDSQGFGITYFEEDIKKASNRILVFFEQRIAEKNRAKEIMLIIHDGSLAKKVKQALEKGDSRLLNKCFLVGHKLLPANLFLLKEYYSAVMKAVYEFAEEKGSRHIEKKDLFFELADLNDYDSVKESAVKKISNVIHLIEVSKKKHNRMVSDYIKDYVDENYMKQETNVGNIAERFGVSSSYIGALFREQEKTTITKYITQLRIRKAAELLAETKLQIQTISKKVGYSDQNYFARIFKKQTGLSPGEYRNNSSH